jgi:eukaryotic-like serine/threonine-protein kinase
MPRRVQTASHSLWWFLRLQRLWLLRATARQLQEAHDSVLQASLESERSRGYVPGHALANRYELLRLLGEGGTGVVWVAHDHVLNLEVAVKLVRASEGASGDFAQRAQTEARSAARLAHPAVCRAVDFGLSEYGEPFIVSELLDGESLDVSLTRAGRLQATHAVRVLLPILDALCAAHESGIVHRDVKPANIFLAHDGLNRLQPKLLDFGIARWSGDAGATRDAGICGTPEYMSPEQARGSDEIDGRSDLWNFCATLYDVVTGVMPFRGDTCQAVLCAVQSVDPEPITTYCAGDDELSAIILRGLSRNPDDRWLSATELSEALCRWLLARGVETDICDHSLRARIGELSGPDSGNDAPYAEVVPHVHSDRDAPTLARGERTLAHGVRTRPWKGLSLAAAGAVMVAAAAHFVPSLLADRAPLARALALLAFAPARAATVDSPPPAAVSPRGGDASRTTPASGTPWTTPTVLRASSPRASVPRTSGNGSTASGPSPEAASLPPPEDPTPAPERSPAPARRPRANALNYDFGF